MLQSQFNFGIQFTKAKGTKKREIEGYASTSNVDRDGQMIPADLLKSAAKKYIEMGTLLFQHGRDPEYGERPIGVLFEASVDRKGRMYVKGKVSDDYIWEKIELGELKAFSIGGIAQWKNEFIDGKEIGVATMIDIYEVSIVSVPANPEAMFSIAKSFQLSYEQAENILDNKKQYNESITINNEELMEEMLKSMKSKIDDLLSKDEEKNELKKSLETLTLEKSELENKVEELTKSLEDEKVNQEALKKSIDELDKKLEGIISLKKEAKTDEQVEEETKEEKIASTEEAVEEVNKLYNVIFKK